MIYEMRIDDKSVCNVFINTLYLQKCDQYRCVILISCFKFLTMQILCNHVSVEIVSLSSLCFNPNVNLSGSVFNLIQQLSELIATWTRTRVWLGRNSWSDIQSEPFRDHGRSSAAMSNETSLISGTSSCNTD